MSYSVTKLVLILILTVSVYGQEKINSQIRDINLSPVSVLDGPDILIDVTSEKLLSNNNISFKIDVSDYASQYMTGQIDVIECSDLMPVKHGEAGIQVRLSYPADDNSHERLGGGIIPIEIVKKGTLNFGIMLDPHAKLCTFQIGLVNCTGKIKIDLNSLALKTLFKKKNMDYICEYSDSVKNRPIHRGVMSPIQGQTNEENFKTLKSWNVNLMRLQLNTSEDWARNNPGKYDEFIDEKIEKVIPVVLDMGEKYGVKIIIDLHASPGSNKMKNSSDGMFNSDASVSKFIAIWTRIARKFKDHPALFGYDLMNEPNQNRTANYDYWKLQEIAASEIRKVDPDTPIYVESNIMCSPLSYYYLSPFKIKNIIYEVHFYEPFDYTHYFVRNQKEVDSGEKVYRSYPGEYYGTYWGSDLKQMQKKLSYVRDFEKRHKAKIYVGEFSAPAYAPGAEKYIFDCIRIFEEYRWDWTYHAFREAKLWDVEYQGGTDDDLNKVTDTPRKQVLLNAFLKNVNIKLDFARVKKVGEGKVEGHNVVCDVPVDKAVGLHGAIFPIDLKPYRNTYVKIQVSAKANEISKPNPAFLGTKFMLIYITPDGEKHYAECNGLYGTFDRVLAINHTVSGDAGMGELRFCMQNVSGNIQYDLSTFEIKKVFQKINCDYICEYSDSVKNRPIHRGVMSPIQDQTNEENFKTLKSWNVNLMRLQLNTSEDWARNNPEKYDEFIDEKIEKVIPAVLGMGEKYGVKIIIDLHTVPGGNTMTEANDGIFNSDICVNKFIEIWKRIARKFKDYPALYGYDLINEPKQTKEVKYDYWTVQKMAAEAIRRIDPETPIFVTSNLNSSQYTFSYLSPLKLKNIIYEVHCYDPFEYTHGKYTSKDRIAGKEHKSYPGIFYGTKWDCDSLIYKLAQVRQFEKNHHAKIYVGEFSTRASSVGGDQFLKDYISIFEKYGWDWTYHAFREAKIWSLEFDGPSDDELIPSLDNSRK
jgi:aryl-phospho-beta-D-glucosidase BglC (GH1 family)